MSKKRSTSTVVSNKNTVLEAVRYITSFEDILLESEKDHLKGLVERGTVLPEAVYGASTKELRDLIRRNPMTG